MARTKTDEELLRLATEFADNHSKFEDTFIESLKETFAVRGSLSPKQRTALENTIERFRMEEWEEENS